MMLSSLDASDGLLHVSLQELGNWLFWGKSYLLNWFCEFNERILIINRGKKYHFKLIIMFFMIPKKLSTFIGMQFQRYTNYEMIHIRNLCN